MLSPCEVWALQHQPAAFGAPPTPSHPTRAVLPLAVKPYLLAPDAAELVCHRLVDLPAPIAVACSAVEDPQRLFVKAPQRLERACQLAPHLVAFAHISFNHDSGIASIKGQEHAVLGRQQQRLAGRVVMRQRARSVQGRDQPHRQRVELGVERAQRPCVERGPDQPRALDHPLQRVQRHGDTCPKGPRPPRRCDLVHLHRERIAVLVPTAREPRIAPHRLLAAARTPLADAVALRRPRTHVLHRGVEALEVVGARQLRAATVNLPPCRPDAVAFAYVVQKGMRHATRQAVVDVVHGSPATAWSAAQLIGACPRPRRSRFFTVVTARA